MKKSILLLLLLIVFLVPGCIIEDTTPTKSKMLGVWKIVEAYDSNTGDDILNKISFPVTAFQLNSDNGINSTAGPMTTYLVYGPNKWTDVSSKIDAVFNYASLNLNTGEFFIEDGVVKRFTLELKLQGFGGSNTLSNILSMLGVQASFLQEVVYHKFMDVKVTFTDDRTMIWDFDELTSTSYNIKDKYGEKVLWGGFSAPFTPCRFVLEKQSKTVVDIIKESNKK